MDLAPIIMFVYNRPEHTKKTIEGLLNNPEAKDSVLYIFADGPKATMSPEGMYNLKATREYIHSIRGFKEIHIDESEINRGLAPATIRGCTEVINRHGKMIMIEDDDVPSPFFLSYVNECLVKFADNPKIWSVCGYVSTDEIPYIETDDDVYLLNRPSSWGFGTWKRCWDKVIWDIDVLQGIFKHKEVARKFNKWGGSYHYCFMWKLFHGQNSSWSVRYHFASYLTDAKSIYPKNSLITNIGLDSTGTHSASLTMHTNMMQTPVKIPDIIKFDEYRNKMYVKSFGNQTLKSRINNYLYIYPKFNSILKLLKKLSF